MEQKQEPQRPKIGTEEVRRAADILRRYHAGKRQLEQRIIDNEQFWKLRHWQQMDKAGQGGNPADPQPTSGWLVNCILSKHADAMDCYPEPTVLPREPGDREEARKLTRILPVVLKKNGFKRTYSSAWWYKLKSGCAVYGVFWDAGKLNGLGDIAIRRMDLLNLFWEPGVTDIQDSPHFFSTELQDREALEERYPWAKGKADRGGWSVSRYLYDDAVDTSGKVLVVDWYYHTRENGRKVLQYCKFVGDTVLYATENDPDMREKGWYDHGKYPFVFDVLFPEEGTPAGYGYVDLCKSPQKQIDLMNQAILKNTLASATPRFFVRSDGAVNENEYADWTRPFVHTNGNLGSDSIAPIQTAGLDSVYVAILQSKIAEMKETAGNRDVANGGTAGGVTAATAIAALQEAGGKLSRNMIDDGYEAFSDVVTLCIELIRQFYSLPRQFRLLGAMGREEFVTYDSRGLQPQAVDDGVIAGYRVPEFDLEVSAQAGNAYASYQLGLYYSSHEMEGMDTQQVAQNFFNCAAQQGYGPGYGALADYALNGRRKNLRRAAQYFGYPTSLAGRDGKRWSKNAADLLAYREQNVRSGRQTLLLVVVTLVITLLAGICSPREFAMAVPALVLELGCGVRCVLGLVMDPYGSYRFVYAALAACWLLNILCLV